MNDVSSVATRAPSRLGTRSAAALLGVLLMSVSAHLALPVPGTPVPMTLQPLGVLLVGGALGASLGASSLALYLVLGVAGLPVFSPYGGPGGILSLIGPTGGYLLAFPLAAAAVGYVAGDGRSTLRVAAGALSGLLLIHLGGLAQLALLAGSVKEAAVLGTWPFLLGDLAKLVAAIGLLRPTIPSLRARL